MKWQALLRRYAPRFALTLALLGIIAYTLYHVISSSAAGLMLTPTRLHTSDAQKISGTAYLFREEQVLTMPEEGLIQDLATDGSKVGKDVPLVEFRAGYTGQERIGTQRLLDSLNRQISVLEDSVVGGGSSMAMADAYRAEATKYCLAIQQAQQQGNWSVLPELESRLLAALNRYQSLIDSSDAVTQRLEQLKSERSLLLRVLCSTVYSTRSSGYFYSYRHVDGYETLFTPAELADLTVTRFDELISSEPVSSAQSFAVGKMAYGYHWYLAIQINPATAAQLAEGHSYEVSFPENQDTTLSLLCDRLIFDDQAPTAVAVFCADEYPTDFVYLRSQRIEISLDTCTGYYIPQSALQSVNGIDGVYIFESSTVHFRKVEILYRGDGFCIVAERQGRGSDYLNLNDLLITSGKNLYEGKVYS